MSNHVEYLEIISQGKEVQWENQVYYKLANEKHFWVEGRFLNFLQSIKRLDLDTEAQLAGLDIGCGNSVTSYQIENHTQWKVDGADLDINGLKYKDRGKGKVFLYDILEKRDSFKSKYDFLILFDVLEHIEDTESFLSACLFHLKEGGYLFINVPAGPNLMSSYDTVQGHFRRYNKKTLFDLLNKEELKILSYRYWGFLMLLPAFLRKFQTNNTDNVDKIISDGFQPKNEAVHNILRFLVKFELNCLPKSIAGTSLMAIAQKNI